jgi:hypothetical protein
MPVTWCVLDRVLWTCGVTLTIFLSPYETVSNETMRGPTTLMSDMRSGDDHSKERSPLRTTPNEFVVSVVKIGRFGNYLSAKKGGSWR